MDDDTALVLGATGKTGRRVVPRLRLLETMRDGGAVVRDSELRYRIGPRLANLTPSAEAHE